jgi:type IV secretory pathway protease TraF
MSGDTVAVVPEGLQVNGAPVATSHTRVYDSRGRRLLSLSPGHYVVKRGELWLLGRHTLSFDSRYFGPVASSSVLTVVRPLLVLHRK